MYDREVYMHVFHDLVNCCYRTWGWILDDEFQVLHTDCPQPEMYQRLFTLPECVKAMKKQREKHDLPLICGVASMISWIVTFSPDIEDVNQYYILGPFFSGYKDEENCKYIFRLLKLDEVQKEKMWQSLRKVPMLTAASMTQYTLMMEYCVRQRKIQVKDIKIVDCHQPGRKLRGRVNTDQFDNRSGFWNMENWILDKVRRGDPTITELGNRMVLLAPEDYRASGKNLEKAKIEMHTLLTLVSRAAVEGGMLRKTAFSLATDYRKKIQDMRLPAEIADLSREMLLDYTQRVQRAKSSMQCSAKVRTCCEYIDTHPEEKISLNMLAEKTGYAPSYLSKKFKEDTGMTVVEYIQKSKVEAAKLLLTTTEKEIEQISGELGFETRSYFSTLFKKQTGMSPTQYREKHQLV